MTIDARRTQSRKAANLPAGYTSCATRAEPSRVRAIAKDASTVTQGAVVQNLHKAPGDWQYGPFAADIPIGTAVPVEVGDQRFVIVRVGDDFYALGDRCTHTGESLAEVGEVDGCEIECTAHGARFDLVSGAPTCLPATRSLPVAEVRVVDGRLQLRRVDDSPSRALSRSSAVR
jgi:3-phenylpropionate/trans-cinnamate dioxygenase ferredoxin component